MKRMFFLVLFFISQAHLFAQVSKSRHFHAWAATPPMGWNSWDCYGPTVTEAEVKSNADYMAKHLKKFGWEYVVVDIRWFVANDKANGYNQKDPQYSIDEFGRFIPAVNRFPSSAEGKGFKPLADYIHNLGLKFGIHIMRGVPVIAVDRHLPIKGTMVTAADIYSKENQCTWLRDMFTIVPGKNGSQEYYNSLFDLYASWGLDFVKVDDLSSPIYFAEEIEMIRKAIDRTGRKIVLSTSPGETPVAHADHVMQHTNMWRTVGDFWDSWNQLKEHFEVFARWNQYRSEEAYPDGDMLPMGRLSIRGERGSDRMTAFTKEEQYTLMTLWSIFKSPLMFGGDLPSNDPFTMKLLTNKDVLNMLKTSTNNKEVLRTEDKVIWMADDPKTNDKYLAVFNTMDPDEIIESNAIFSSGLINRETKGHAQLIDIDLKGATKLYLVVGDGGDGIGWDHGDWIQPTLYNGDDSLLLTELRWKRAQAGWGDVQINRSVSGNRLTVNNTEYTNGIGTHSNSIIEFDVPAGYTRFKALAGVDKAGAEQNTGSTVKFFLFAQNPSGPAPPSSVKINVNLKDIGCDGWVTVKDMWSGKDLGIFSSEFAPEIARHGAGLYRIARSPVSKKK